MQWLVGLAVTLSFILLSTKVSAEPLAQEAIYYRCYQQLVRGVAPPSDPLFMQVKSGAMPAVDACMNLVGSALLTPANQISDPNSRLQKGLISNLHEFHNSWFSEKRFVSIDSCIDPSTGDLFDSTQPAIYLTRALLTAGVPYSSIVTSSQTLQPKRQLGIGDDANLGADSRLIKTTYPYGPLTANPPRTSVNYAEKGHVIGVTNMLSTVFPTTYTGTTNNIDISQNYGAGILGDPYYLMTTIKERLDYQSDGSVRVPRKWTKSVFNDLLCRQLPMIRRTDGDPWLDANANAPFRKTSACIRCHATMDRMAGVIRNIRYEVTSNITCTDANPVGSPEPRDPRAVVVHSVPVSEGAVGAWSSAADDLFSRRPPQGVLYYRSYDGTLINLDVTNLTTLGQALAQTNDLYVCAAKRYYEFFTGISADLRDINDPMEPISLNSAELAHRNRVIQIGLSLKQHQNLRQMVRDIFSTPTYQDSNYGVTP